MDWSHCWVWVGFFQERRGWRNLWWLWSRRSWHHPLGCPLLCQWLPRQPHTCPAAPQCRRSLWMVDKVRMFEMVGMTLQTGDVKRSPPILSSTLIDQWRKNWSNHINGVHIHIQLSAYNINNEVDHKKKLINKEEDKNKAKGRVLDPYRRWPSTPNQQQYQLSTINQYLTWRGVHPSFGRLILKMKTKDKKGKRGDDKTLI